MQINCRSNAQSKTSDLIDALIASPCLVCQINSSRLKNSSLIALDSSITEKKNPWISILGLYSLAPNSNCYHVNDISILSLSLSLALSLSLTLSLSLALSLPLEWSIILIFYEFHFLSFFVSLIHFLYEFHFLCLGFSVKRAQTERTYEFSDAPCYHVGGPRRAHKP